MNRRGFLARALAALVTAPAAAKAAAAITDDTPADAPAPADALAPATGVGYRAEGGGPSLRYPTESARGSSPRCAWTFKDSRCGYDPDERGHAPEFHSCGGTFAECLERGCCGRFGGFLEVPLSPILERHDPRTAPVLGYHSDSMVIVDEAYGVPDSWVTGSGEDLPPMGLVNCRCTIDDIHVEPPSSRVQRELVRAMADKLDRELLGVHGVPKGLL